MPDHMLGSRAHIPDELKALASEKGFYISGTTAMAATCLILTPRGGPRPRPAHEYFKGPGRHDGPSVYDLARIMLETGKCDCVECVRRARQEAAV